MKKFIRKIRSLRIFVAAYASALAARRVSNAAPRRILLVAAGKLGDVVCTTPVMRAIREYLPDAQLYVREYGGVNAALLADSGLADGYLRADTVPEYVAALRRERIDTVLMTGPSPEDLSAALIARVPCIVAPRVAGGLCPHQTRPYLALLRFVREFPFAMGAYAPRERLRALEPLGIRVDDTRKQLGFSEKARVSVAAFLSEHHLEEKSFAVVSPSAGNKIKEWPADRFARVAGHVARRGLPVVITDAKRDSEQVAATMAAAKNQTGIINASGRFSIDELKALIARSALFVSADSGPLYIAEAFGVPTVDIVGPIDEREQPPIAPPRHVVVVPKRDKPQLYVMNARVYDYAEARRQAQASTVEEVVAAIDKVYAAVK